MDEFFIIHRYHFNFNYSEETLLENLNWKLNEKWNRIEDFFDTMSSLI